MEGRQAMEDWEKETEIKLESLTVMNLKPDDILVFKTDLDKITQEEMDEYRVIFSRYTGLKNKIVFIPLTDDISAIRQLKEG